MYKYRLTMSVCFEAQDENEAEVRAKKIEAFWGWVIASPEEALGFQAKGEAVDYVGGDLVRLDDNGKKAE